MVNTGTIVISGIETKDGTRPNGTPWHLTKVVSETGQKYSTFDTGMGHIAASNIGKTATITYTSNDKGHDLETLTITGEIASTAHDYSPPPPPPTDGPDWDKIGRQKTRCALWAAILSNPSIHSTDIPALTTVGFARELVIAAEQDIFERGAVVGDFSDVPF